MYTGKLILYFHHGEIQAAACIGETEAQLQLLCSDGACMQLPPQRVLHAEPLAAPVSEAPARIQAAIAQAVEAQQQLARDISPRALWQGLHEKPAACRLAGLARSAFGREATPSHAAAVLRALVQDRIYFRLTGATFHAHSPEQVETLAARDAQDRRRRDEIARCAAWLRAAAAGTPPDDPVRKTCIAYLSEFAACGTDATRHAHIREILKLAGGMDQKQCFQLLVALGKIDPDENLLLLRHNVPHTWTGPVQHELESVSPPACARRSDLTHITACTIDEPFTRDIDDAISFDIDGDSCRLGIHISDAASCLPAGSAIDNEAALRGTSLYLPEGKIPMLPPALSENRLSLIKGEPRPVISFFVTLNGDGEILDRSIRLGLIRVTDKLSYQAVDDDISAGGRFARLHEMLLNVRARRRASGASGLLIPELQVRVDERREITLAVRERETPAQGLVAECMILANHTAALFLRDRQVPALYRTQKPPRHPSPPGDAPLAGRLRMRRSFSRVIIDTAPGPHSTLGLDCYSSVTSPLRKYLDLVVQRQLASALQDAPPVYTREQLHDIASSMQPVLTRAGLVEQERTRYWLLKKLSPLKGRKLPAVVITKRYGKYTVLLTEYLLELTALNPAAQQYNPGQEIMVELTDIDPFYGTIAVTLP